MNTITGLMTTMAVAAAFSGCTAVDESTTPDSSSAVWAVHDAVAPPARRCQPAEKAAPRGPQCVIGGRCAR